MPPLRARLRRVHVSSITVTAPIGISTALQSAIAELAATSWAADVFDDEWRLVWVSDALRSVLGEPPEGELGVGEHILVVRQRPVWQAAIAPAVRREVLLRNAPYWMHETPGGRGAFLAMVPDDLREAVSAIEPAPPPPLWAWELRYQDDDDRPLRAAAVAARLHDVSGQRVGAATLFGPGISARIYTMLLRGDEAAFERMAALVEPARRRTAILFADVEASTMLTRRLATQRYFELIRELTTQVDEIVIEHRGLVGKHVGDGITAFFPAREWGSDSAAARAALEAAREIVATADRVVGGAWGQAERGAEHTMNVAVHWGPEIFIGQLVTGGRLEVTALGDEVNETARIEQAASGGELLVTKALIEQLDPEDARALRIPSVDLEYRVVADEPAADEKSVRDAGDIPVVALSIEPPDQ
jgi:class 3 adenylate cyclase